MKKKVNGIIIIIEYALEDSQYARVFKIPDIVHLALLETEACPEPYQRVKMEYCGRLIIPLN